MIPSTSINTIFSILKAVSVVVPQEILILPVRRIALRTVAFPARKLETT
jgi:hypothetical protein